MISLTSETESPEYSGTFRIFDTFTNQVIDIEKGYNYYVWNDEKYFNVNYTIPPVPENIYLHISLNYVASASGKIEVFEGDFSGNQILSRETGSRIDDYLALSMGKSYFIL